MLRAHVRVALWLTELKSLHVIDDTARNAFPAYAS